MSAFGLMNKFPAQRFPPHGYANSLRVAHAKTVQQFNGDASGWEAP